MSAETELLWPGVALLLLLGAVASLCVRCSRSGKGGIVTGRGWEGSSWAPWRRRQCTPKLSQARPGCVWEGPSDKPHKTGVTPPRAGPTLHLNAVWFTGGLWFCCVKGYVWGGGCSGRGRKGWAGRLGHPPLLRSPQ